MANDTQRTHSALGEHVVGNLLTTAARRFGDAEAFFCSATGRRIGFRDLNTRCNRLVHALQAQGLRQGDCVAFLSSNRTEIVEIYFALAKGGYVGMPLNYRLAPAEMRALMQDVDAAALLFEDRFAEAAHAACTDLSSLRVRVAFGEAGQPLEGVLRYEDLLNNGEVHEPQVVVHEHDPYYYNLTSGTTGLPKCYVISHYNNATIGNVCMALDMSNRDVVLTLIPMYGRIGFLWLATSVMYGIRNVLMNFAPDEALALIAQERVTISNLVPTMGAMLLASPRLAQTDLSSLRGLIFAGSLLPAPVREGVMARLCPHLYEYYGMQESSALVVSTPADRRLRADSVGRPILFCEVRVVDEQGRDVPAGETGAIIGRAAGSVTAYHRNPAKTAETFVDGWLHTGDLGRLDEDGFLFINGRLKDLIVTGGQNVHAGEVEEAILRVPGVADCAVIGLPDPLWGEAVTAVVVPAPGAQVDEAAVIAQCRQSLAGFKAPKRVIAQGEALPRTPTGKVQKFLLVERYQASA
ncbi:hypothetical protein CCO03_04445 [Comamonas serinivorans]|uniref:AMP-dependent synthetase n=1 Tax=Comamonas serinivorans TaxID=1082851 RepID=A0A1Y0EK56_9BURK|nr:AMP-binding protein [Comamonas serinivorans]ARU04023.1 hypothetical protein CCO03_04445 [Comamonas serinivorans]